METPIRFIVIDDDATNNMLCHMVITKVDEGLDIQTFSIPEKGFEYIVNEYTRLDKAVPTVLFLDINMPSWTGWEFLKQFEILDEKIKRQIKIYILSSSINPKDIQCAQDNSNVVAYIVKPLSLKTVSNILKNSNTIFLSEYKMEF